MSDRLDSLLRPGSIVKSNKPYRPDAYLDAKCPILSTLLSMTTFEDKPRACATLLLFTEDGKSKVCINNKAQGTVGFVTVDSFESVFEEIETLLADGKVDFRPSRGNGRKY